MGHYYSRNFNYQDEPATRYGPDPEIFEKYEDTDRPVRGWSDFCSFLFILQASI